MKTKNVRINKEARHGKTEGGRWIKPSIAQWWQAEKNLNTLTGHGYPQGWNTMSDDLKALSFSQEVVMGIEKHVALISKEVVRLTADPLYSKGGNLYECTNMMHRINTFSDALYWRKAYPTVMYLGSTTQWPQDHSIKAYTGYGTATSIQTGFALRPIIPQVVSVAVEKAQVVCEQFQGFLDIRTAHSTIRENERRIKADTMRKTRLEATLEDWPTDEWTANETALNEWLDNKPAFLKAGGGSNTPNKVIQGMRTHMATASDMKHKANQLKRQTEIIAGCEVRIAISQALLTEMLGDEEE